MKLSDLNQESKYPEWACLSCLFEAGGKPVRLIIEEYIKGKCPVCGKRAELVAPRDFGYPVIDGCQFKEVVDN